MTMVPVASGFVQASFTARVRVYPQAAAPLPVHVCVRIPSLLVWERQPSSAL